MLRLYFRNVPDEVRFDPTACEEFCQNIARAAGMPAHYHHVEMYIEDVQYRRMSPSGKLCFARGVHVFVEWSGQSQEVKDEIAQEIHRFLERHNLSGGDEVVIFRDRPAGAFYLWGKRVSGGMSRI